MAGDFLAVKKDDGNVISKTFEKLWILRNIHLVQLKVRFFPATLQNLLRAVTEVTARLGVDGDAMHAGPARGGYVPSCQLVRYFFCSAVKVSILTPIALSFRAAMFSSMLRGTG